MTLIEKISSGFYTYIIPSLSYIGEVLCILSVIFIMITFLGREGKVTRWTFIPGLIYIGIVSIVNILFAGKDFHVLYFILIVPVIIFSAYFTFTKKWILNSIIATLMMFVFETYISCEMLYAGMYFSEEPKNYMLGYSGGEGYLGTGFSTIFIISYLFIMLAIFLALYFGMIKKQRTMYIGWKYRIAFIIWEVLMITITYMPVMNGVSGRQQIKYMEYEIGVIMLSMGLVVPFLFTTIISRRYAVEKTLIQEDYISAELDYINQYKKNQTETRAFRHDIINNLSVLSTMHSEKKYDAIEEYLSSLLENISAMSLPYKTGDEMLNCIVGMKSAKMEEEGIKLSVDGTIDGGLGMKPVDVCSIFANALDNAIEACQLITDDMEKWISLSLNKTNESIFIKLSNTMTTEDNVSNKENSLHGYGIQNMKATISRYGGIGKVETDDNIFTLSIRIPIIR